MRFKPNLSNRWFLYSMFCLLIMLVFWTNFRNYNLTLKLATDEKISILQEKMRLLEQQHHKAEHEINHLQATLNEKFNETYQPEWSEKNLYYEEIMAHLKNISEGFSFVKPEAHPEPLQADFVYSAMPHLMDHPKARYPAFQILSPRKSSEVDVVIGIPTVKRVKEIYLPETIKSLIDHMTTDQLARTLIVVSIGEATDLEYVARTTYTINSMFEPYFGQLIEVISPTKYWYPDFANMEPTLGDSHKRTQWRTKQNLDAIFLMSYAQSKGTYYLMLEDDVLAKADYMTNIMKFAESETISKPNWVFIDFSAIGGIGKFIRVDNLRVFSAYVQILHKYMPIDWLIELYLASRVCGIGNNTNKCGTLKETIRPTYKRSLFEHIGLFSSLQGKTQKVKPNLRKDRHIPLFYPHKNPRVDYFISSILVEKNHTIERAYNGEDFFWGKKPQVNDTIEFWFSEPQTLDSFVIQSGNHEHQGDIIEEGMVEVLPNMDAHQSDKFISMADFDEFGLAEGSIDPEIGPLKAIRIRILKNMTHWIIINEIGLHAVGVEGTLLESSSSKH